MTEHPGGHNPLLHAALGYARRGWPVFPCREKDETVRRGDSERVYRTKAPYTHNGVKDATTDEQQILAWWKRWPKAMIGLAMGHNRCFALDFDPRIDEASGEIFTLERLKAETEAQIGCALPETLAAVTPSDGVHVYFLQPAGEPIRNRGNLPEHVDVRGLGGYVIAPPSITADNKRYRWLRGNWNAEIAEAPEQLVEVLRARRSAPVRDPVDSASPSTAARSPSPERGGSDAVRRYALAALDGECQAVRSAGSGSRNRQLNESALKVASLVAAGAIDAMVARSSIEAAARDNPGRDDDRQLLATIDSGWSAGINNPRDLGEVAASARERSERRSSRGSGARLREPPAPSSEDNGSPSSRHGRSPGSSSEGREDSHGGGSGNDRSGGGAGDDFAARLMRQCAFLPLTDLGNAERFLKRHGRDFLYVPEWGWLAWDGRRWNREHAEALVSRAVYDTVRAIGGEADFIEATGSKGRMGETGDELDFIVKAGRGDPLYYSETIRKWGRTSESVGHLSCIARLAQPWLTAQPSDFDADPLKINLANGTLQLIEAKEGLHAEARMLPHKRRDRMTKIAEVAYDPGAPCPLYDRFLERVQPDEADRRFLHAWGGYNLTGDISAQKLVFNYGMGANGKSTWVDVVAFVAGDYAASVRVETFLDQGKGRRGGDATPDLAALAGRRMVRTSEPERGSKFADALIKLVTGGEPLTVRELNMPFFEMLVNFKITISGNHKPDIGNDHGIWRRMRLMPWQVTIPEDEQDDSLTMKLRGEASGILNHLVAGALDWLSGGLPESSRMLEATQDYKESSDPLGRFLSLCVAPQAGARVQSSLLYGVFEGWAKWAGETVWSQKGFTKAMLDKGYIKKQSNNIVWLDIDLTRQRSDFVDHDGNPLPMDLESVGATPAPSSVTRRDWEDDDDEP